MTSSIATITNYIYRQWCGCILQLERSPGKQPTCRRSLLALTTKVCPAAWHKSAWCLLLEVREWEENNSFGVWSLVKFSSTLVLVARPNFIFENSASYVFTRWSCMCTFFNEKFKFRPDKMTQPIKCLPCGSYNLVQFLELGGRREAIPECCPLVSIYMLPPPTHTIYSYTSTII